MKKLLLILFLLPVLCRAQTATDAVLISIDSTLTNLIRATDDPRVQYAGVRVTNVVSIDPAHNWQVSGSFYAKDLNGDLWRVVTLADHSATPASDPYAATSWKVDYAAVKHQYFSLNGNVYTPATINATILTSLYIFN